MTSLTKVLSPSFSRKNIPVTLVGAVGTLAGLLAILRLGGLL